MRDLHFECTQCGACCHGLRLALTVPEALAWLRRGQPVEVLVEALPWLAEPPAGDRQAAQKRRRSFAAVSGRLPVRVVAALVAAFDGPCPNLQADQRCAIYTSRPLVCRIYPAEVNPLIELLPAHKACPPEAWTPAPPLLLRQGQVLDAELAAQMAQARDSAQDAVPTLQRLCAELGIHTAAMANDGFVAHRPAPGHLLQVLERIVAGEAGPPSFGAWTLVSHLAPTLTALAAVDALCAPADTPTPGGATYLPLRAAP
jgi:Fe-S-cluster containining protein